MLAVISPAKTLDYESSLTTKKRSTPQFVQESTQLISHLRQLAPPDLSSLMGISANLAEVNHERYANWHPCFDGKDVRPALLAFKGDVYIGLDAPTLGERDFTWAQKHLRILSGLHGLLRPLDTIHPYRLEMGTRLDTPAGTNLYDFWGDKITNALNTALHEQHTGDQKQPILVNLASNEYFAAVKPRDVAARIINVQFKELRDGQYRFLSFFAKKARGSMARYMIDQRVKTLSALKRFDYDGYSYNQDLSQGDEWVFTRSTPDTA